MTFATILFLIGAVGILTGIGLDIYGKCKGLSKWSEVAHDVAGRSFLVWVAAIFVYMFSK